MIKYICDALGAGDNVEMKYKFAKNLFQTLCNSLGLLFMCLVLTFFCLIQKTESDVLILVAIAMIGPIVLYFAIGFYWIFQTVIIDEKGISVLFFKKTLTQFAWEDIVSIEKSNIYRNPIYKIVKSDGKELNLDKRKKIKNAIELYYKNEIKE